MTKLLDQAIEKIRALPDEEQDEVAEILFVWLSKSLGPVQLDDETRAAVRKGLEQARRGQFATDEEVAAVFNRFRE
jgi:hypothetical protein